MSILFRILAANILALCLTVGMAMVATQSHAETTLQASATAAPAAHAMADRRQYDRRQSNCRRVPLPRVC